MPSLAISFDQHGEALSIRRFVVQEEMSSLFSVSVWGYAPHDDLDLETFVGHAATFRVTSGMAFAAGGGSRQWTGVCQRMEHLSTESTGLSLYYVRIVPRLWLLTQKSNHRLFQHKNIPDMVDVLLDPMQIEKEWRIDRKQYPQLELRTQYGETDFAFLNRLLEEAGISYFFAEDPKVGTRLVFSDAPQAAEARAGGVLPHVDNANQSSEREFVANARASRDVRPGRVTFRDHDFRRKPTVALLGKTPPFAGGIEDQLEVFAYRPGLSLVEMEASAARKFDEAMGVFAAKAVDALAGQAAERLSGVLGPVGDAVAHFAPSATGHFGLPSAGDAAAMMKSAVPSAGDASAMLKSAASGGMGGMVKKAGDKAVDGLVHKAEGFVGDKVGGFVEKELGKLAGGVVGDLAGDLVGDLAGNIAGKIAGKIGGAVKAQLGRLVGDDKGFARHDDKMAQRRSQEALESLRATANRIRFTTNALDMAPGVVFSMSGHPREMLSSDKRLFVTSMMLEGTHDGEWDMSGEATPAAVPFRPPQHTPKPSVQGMQSAMVVGPPGEEIYTDELGRIRVQFHWDREGGRDDNSSCWMRVAQGSAGAGYGMIAVPRVGQEVLVSFLEGDPDLPIVVGSMFSSTAPVLHDLPQHKTRSAWRGQSSPGGGGTNEIMMDDAKGKELVYLLAERNMQQIVRKDRGTVVGKVDSMLVGEKYSVHVAQAASPPPKIPATGIEVVDKKITFTTGEASITLEKDTITLWAKKGIRVLSEGENILVETKKGDIRIQGGPNVMVNCGGEDLAREEDEKKKSAKPTPKDVQKAIDEAKELEAAGKTKDAAVKKQEAIDKAIQCYGIDTRATKSIRYDPHEPDNGGTISKNGVQTVTIGDSAYTSAGWLGSTIGHEAEIHAKEQAAKDIWYGGKQGSRMMEVQAYDYEIANASSRYGLTGNEVFLLYAARTPYYNNLTAENKARVDGNPPMYTLPKGREKD